MSQLALVFDTETSGMIEFAKTAEDPVQPWPVEIAWQLVNLENWSVYQQFVGLVRLPAGTPIDAGALAIHGINPAMVDQGGIAPAAMLGLFLETLAVADLYVCHSVNFDRRVMETLRYRMDGTPTGWLKTRPSICTMLKSTAVCRVAKTNGRGGYKWPTLVEAHRHFTGLEMGDAHTALADVKATVLVLKGLIEGGQVCPQEAIGL